jgi:di/tripeptidase
MKLGLIEALKIKKQDLQELLHREATSHGKLSWLFLPENSQHKIALVAHIDTVHDDEPDRQIIVDEATQTLWSPQGLGADDRAGVWTILNIFFSVPEIYRPIVLLTDLEECGGLGAREAADIFAEHLSMATFFIELDRRGECVFYNSESPEFVAYIESFGFYRNRGIFSDISIICPAVNRCGVNLSMGYYHAHTKKEYLNLTHMDNTREALPALLKDNYEKKKIWFLDTE